MTITKVNITKDGSYHCLIDDIDHFIPDDDPQALERFGVTAWLGEGNTPTPYVAPETPFPDRRIKGDGSIGDQLDMQYRDLKDGTTEWKDHIAKVKSDIPKS